MAEPAVAGRSLADRLASFRQPVARPAVVREDRLELLARWFGARTLVVEDGRALVVERQLPLPAEVSRAVAERPAAAYFDTETTGLSTGAGTVIFLAGVARVRGDTMIVRQYLLPDYPFERPLLRALAADLAAADRLVTYNGRTFDMPMLAARLTFHGLFREQATVPDAHDDLLPTARRLFRRPLGGARLADVEAGVLGVRREVDCPGSEVPARYFGYLSGGSPDILAVVLDHNFQDVVSLALLEAELARLRAGGWRDAAVLDPRGHGAGPPSRRRRRRCAGAGRVGAGDRRRSGRSQRATASRLAPAAWRPARSSARRTCGGSARVGRRWMPPPPGSRWRAFASGTATTWPARWPPPRRPRGCWTWRWRWGGVAAWMPSAAPGCGSRAVSGASGAG